MEPLVRSRPWSTFKRAHWGDLPPDARRGPRLGIAELFYEEREEELREEAGEEVRTARAEAEEERGEVERLRMVVARLESAAEGRSRGPPRGFTLAGVEHPQLMFEGRSW